MNANSRWQEVIAENLASSSIPGFKKQEISTAAVQAGLIPAGGLTAKSAQFFSLPKASTAVSFASGDIQFTGNKNDVAIEGKGFFQVQLPTGQIASTRDGEFQLNAKGQLVTKSGYTVMGEGGPIQIDLNNSTPLTISSTGDVSQGADTKGKLKIVEFNNPQLLSQISGGYFLANDPNIKPLPGTSTLRQGYIEASNTSIVREMANMMTAVRGFEANQHIIQIQSDRMAKLISDLGTPPA